MTTLPVCIEFTLVDNRYLYDLGQVQAAYALDLPIAFRARPLVNANSKYGILHFGRVMSISRDGTPGWHIVKLLSDKGVIEFGICTGSL